MDDFVSLHKIKVFCHVVRHKNITRAAEELHIAQPAVTAHVRSLERKLGTRLVIRQGRNIQISEAGRAFYVWANDMLAQYRDTERRIRGYSNGERGSAVISASMSVGSYVLPRILGRYSQANPHAQIRLTISHPAPASQKVHEGECDFAVLHFHTELTREELNIEHLGREELIIVAANDDARIGASTNISELTRIPFVASPIEQIRELEEIALRSLGVANRQIAIELGHPEAIKQAIRDRLGIGVLFRSAVEDDLAKGQLRTVGLKGARMHVPIVLVHSPSKVFSPLQERLIDHIRGELTKSVRPDLLPSEIHR
jgi:LysR family transcriptional regulator, low CO2-responsive transcriptional regulator